MEIDVLYLYLGEATIRKMVFFRLVITLEGGMRFMLNLAQAVKVCVDVLTDEGDKGKPDRFKG